jgi:hypothetical protein
MGFRQAIGEIWIAEIPTKLDADSRDISNMHTVVKLEIRKLQNEQIIRVSPSICQ